MLRFIFFALIFTKIAHAQVHPEVRCVAKLWKDGQSIDQKDLIFAREVNDYRYFEAEIEGITFAIKSPTTLFYFEPSITYPNGDVISSGGFFPASKTIRLLSTRTLDEHDYKADLRCCHQCSFRDW